MFRDWYPALQKKNKMKQRFRRNLLTLAFVLLTQVSLGQESLTSNTRGAVINQISKLVMAYYVYPEKANKLAEKLKFNQSIGKYDSLGDPRELAHQLTREIRELTQDKHIRIQYDKELEKDLLEFLASPKKSNRISEADLAIDQSRNFYFKRVEILPLNIGYVELNGFALPSKSTSETIYAAMGFVAHTNAVILDLRNNFGGNAEVANEILSYFFSEKQFIGRSYNKIEDVWTDQYAKRKSSKKLVLSMPIYVLVSDRTFSAAEGLAYHLQQLRKAIVIGEQTRGGAHLTRSFSAGNGFVAFIPYSRSENAKTNTDWEGTGVQPQVHINEGQALNEAQDQALQSMLAHQTDEVEKRKINYAINILRSHTPIPLLDQELLAVYTGTYEYFEVSNVQHQLYFQDTKNHKKPIPITPIATNLFQVGNEYQIAFQVNEDGKCTGFEMYWEDGWRELISKIKN